MIKKMQEMSRFLPWKWEEIEENPCAQALKTHLQKSLQSELPVEAWRYITPSASYCHVSITWVISEITPWRHVRFPLKPTWARTLSTCGHLQLNSNFQIYQVLKAGHDATSSPTRHPSLYLPSVATAFKCYLDIEGRTRPCFSMSHSTTPRCRTRYHSAADQTSFHSRRTQIANIGCFIRSHVTSTPQTISGTWLSHSTSSFAPTWAF